MKVLALDFDGVIADSQYECLIVGFNSYLKMHKNTKLFGGQKITFNNFNKLRRKYKTTIDRYKKLRPYVIDAFCWFAILYIIERNIKIKNQAQYNKIRKKLMKRIYDKYVKFFYNERYLLQKDFDRWLELEVPFKKIINAIKRLKKKYTIAIATNNRKASILSFLKNYNIKPRIISDSRISIDKKEQLEHIKAKLRVDFEDILFVDDQEKHFPNLLRLGVNCYLAAWGYNTREQQKEARQQGAVLLNEDNFYKELENFR